MKSNKPGTSTLAVEVTNISRHALWLMINGREYMLDYVRFPWFEDATVKQLVHIVVSRNNNIRWPDLDVDLDIDTIAHPEKYPLTQHVSQHSP